MIIIAIMINTISHRPEYMLFAIFGALSLPMINPVTTGGSILSPLYYINNRIINGKTIFNRSLSVSDFSLGISQDTIISITNITINIHIIVIHHIYA